MRCAFGPCDDQPVARTVLIVDDHAPFRALARALLQLEGFEVVGEVADAWSALGRGWAAAAGCGGARHSASRS